VYKLPAPQRTGPTLPDEIVTTTSPPEGENKSTGTTSLHLTQKGHVEAEQSWFNKETQSFENAFISDFSCLNKSESVLAITKITSDYLGKDGAWIPMKTVLGSKEYRGYSWNYDASNFGMEGMQQMDLAIRSTVTIKAPQLDRVHRAHKSLPQPLLIRVTFEDADQKKTQITTTFVNPPISLITKDRRMKDGTCFTEKTQAFDIWYTLDDANFETRLYVEGSFNTKESRFETCSNDRNHNSYLTASQMQKIAWKAAQNKQTESEIERLAWKNDAGLSVQCWALIDINNHRSYGLKWQMTTTTGSATEYYLFPKEMQTEE